MLQNLTGPLVIFEDKQLFRADIFSAAYQLSEKLRNNPAAYVINLCEQRHEFIAILLAAALANKASILPPDLAPESLRKVHNLLRDCQQIDSVDTTLFAHNKAAAFVAQFSALHLNSCQIYLFTSGTTGDPKPICKTFAEMLAAAKLAVERFQLTSNNSMIGTVPGQHMYGLETTVFSPLISYASVWYRKVFFIDDMLEALKTLGTQTCYLVSTPLHLEKTLLAQKNIRNIPHTIISATAPLKSKTAQQLEHQYTQKVVEVYGSTETCSIATRATAHTRLWRPYTDINLRTGNKTAEVYLPYMGSWLTLNDQVSINKDGQFELLGRNNDLVKVAGKRHSLAFLHELLQQVPGVQEGALLMSSDEQRLVAFVVTTQKDIEEKIREVFLHEVDPVFIPRPIIHIDQLPRSATGKVQISALRDMLP
jgi:acyl-coenzyme A synthetase/AMP-(fatty) acid ligase